MVSYHRLTGLGILASCSCCPRRSVHFVPVNLQQDKGYCLFCNFLYELAFFFLTRGVKYIDLLFPFKYFILASYFNVASGQQKVSDIESTPKEYHCLFQLKVTLKTEVGALYLYEIIIDF